MPLVRGEVVSTLVLNTAALLVGCVEGDRPLTANATFTAVRHPEVFTRIGLVVADPSDMARAWNEADLSLLSEEELTQVRYHGPRRVGDILFNWFD